MKFHDIEYMAHVRYPLLVQIYDYDYSFYG